MTSSITMGRGLRSALASTDPPIASGGGTTATAILDWKHPEVVSLTTHIRTAVEPPAGGDSATVTALQRAYQIIRDRVRPVYAMNDRLPASVTLRRAKGSCSQRMAVLEAIARALSVPTRVRGLLVDGEFWRPRFATLMPFVPTAVLIAWPQFHLRDSWLDISDLFSTAHHGSPFTNAGGETLFDAIGRGAARWDHGVCDCDDPTLQGNLRRDLGTFDSRDALFDAHGQTLRTGIRIVIDPVFSRWSAGA